MNTLTAPMPVSPEKSSHSSPYLTGLNAPQQEAVEVTDGPLLVLAGAGTGKTRVLTTRIAHLLLSKKAFPGQILSVTFTNKAAAEMKERIGKMLGEDITGMWLGTFHSICARILRRHAEHVGLNNNYVIIDMDDQLRLLKTLMADLHLDDKRWPPKTALAIIQSWKDKGLTPDKVNADYDTGFAAGKMIALYKAYQQRLKTINAADFGDLILHCITIFSQHPEVLEEYARRFRYILVDEYQDTNVAQYLWLRLLAVQHHNLCCVGDDDQSIYSWRGAEVGHILKFEKDFPDAQIIRLEQNYRSTQPILTAASALISHNKERLGKTLWTEAQEGENITVRAVWDDRDEARTIGEDIETLHRKGQALNSIAILVRAGFQTRAFEEQFLSMSIPYRIIGGLRFYERKEIRDMLAYLRVIMQPHDDLALERIINTPRRGVGKATVEGLQQQARADDVSLTSIIEQQMQGGGLKGKARTGITALFQQFERWRGVLGDMTPDAFVDQVMEESGYHTMLQDEHTVEADGRLENLKELVRAVAEFESIAAFLEHVGLVADREANVEGGDDMVTLMTLHGSKGLEFDNVFLPGWEEGLFPHQRAIDEEGRKGVEEERRLAYVGLTRARKRLTITHASSRRIHNQFQNCIASRFLDELPEEVLDIINMDGGSGYGKRSSLQQQIEAIMGGASGSLSSRERAGGEGRHSRHSKNSPHPNPLPEGEGTYRKKGTSSIQAKGTEKFPIGCKVQHSTFGQGRVIAAREGRLDVCFDTVGIKKVLEEYVKRG